MTIATHMATFLEKSSWIRKMFEEGARLKAIHGAERVFDFSLGNPYMQPPQRFKEQLKRVAECDQIGIHSYMPNPGYPFVRESVAAYLSGEYGADISENEILMTCGAAGGLNVILKTILDPGDEVITPAPYFVEYGFYADNHGGRLKTVQTHTDFTLNLAAIEEAITDKTKAVLINSPNNPTGQIYSKESIDALGDLLLQKSRALDRTIYLVSDEPYRKIVYDGITVPSIFSAYPNSLVATSYSKDLSIPGERIGFIAINPRADYKTDLISAMALANRILGFVNAPAFMQRLVGALQGESVDISHYARKRELLCDGLKDCGYDFVKPPGTFYLFPRSPIEDDVKFVQALQEELILAVPGSGFGGPGHIRLAFCVDDQTITDAMPGFEKAIKRFT
ncbi:MAG: pyridoxal phosphate-dependent aminotransferase [Desulfobacterales bacterium]|nr:pyridoxal phosphate-dependent aminotransferase [Desulfobacterales bacterium]